MSTLPKLKKTSLAVLLALGATSAHAVLEREGPISAVHGYPVWYQDKSGLTLEFCSPLNQRELDEGWCLLVTGDTTVPEVFPSSFADEHFWWAGDAIIDPSTINPAANIKRALLVLGMEAAFGAGPVKAGDQIAFARIRVRLDDVPVSGTYRFIHPFGEEIQEAVAGERIFFSDDHGIQCPPGQFQCALESRVGPFLLPANTPGGAELPPVSGPVAGKLYIADPAREGPVTGSQARDLPDDPPGTFREGGTDTLRSRNIFRIEGPPGSQLGLDPVTGDPVDYLETTNFTLMGRIFQGTIPGRVAADRASYVRTGTSQKVDLFVTALPTRAGRMPGGSLPPAVPPALSFYDVPCGTQVLNEGTLDEQVIFTAPSGAGELLMQAAGNSRWAQLQPRVLPASLCIKDNSAQPAPAYFQAPVKDELRITNATYDPAAGQLVVTAESGDAGDDEGNVPLLSLDGFQVTPVTGSGTFTVPVAAPPSSVFVISSAGGTDRRQVETGLAPGGGAGGTPLVANNFTIPTSEDTPSAAVDLTAYSSDVNGWTVNLLQAPSKGVYNIATRIYTPNLNANGSDSFTYRLVDGTRTSNIATVTVTIAPVNDAPVASDDTAGTTVGTQISIPVTANDTDVDGDALTAVTISTVTGPAAATATANGGSIDFSAATPGTYTFTYQASDGNEVSNTANVTVNVAGAEVLNVTTAQFRTRQGRWRVDGTSSVQTAHTVTISFVGNCTGVIASGVPVTLGAFALDLRGVGPYPGDLRNPDRPTDCTQVRAESDLGGVDPSTAIQIRN